MHFNLPTLNPSTASKQLHKQLSPLCINVTTPLFINLPPLCAMMILYVNFVATACKYCYWYVPCANVVMLSLLWCKCYCNCIQMQLPLFVLNVAVTMYKCCHVAAAVMHKYFCHCVQIAATAVCKILCVNALMLLSLCANFSHHYF